MLIGAHTALQFIGLQYVTSAVGAVIVGLIPIFTPLFAHLLLPDEGLSLTGGVGIMLGFFGMLIIAQPSPTNLLTSDVHGIGFLCLSAVVFALGAVLTRHSRTHTALPMVSMQAWMMIVSAIELHVVTAVLPNESIVDITWTIEAVVAVSYLALVASVGGYLIYFELLDQLGPIEINLITYALPIPAGLAGWLVFGELIDRATAIGFIIIFISFVTVKQEAIRDEMPLQQTSAKEE